MHMLMRKVRLVVKRNRKLYGWTRCEDGRKTERD